MESATRRNWPLHLTLLAVAAVFFAYVFGWPLATAMFEPQVSAYGVRLGPPPVAHQVRMRLFEAVIAGWFFLFGASIGSFLNVVIYRVPRGLSLLGSSFCPKCRHAIRWRDNLPVFGWLHLRGRCRDCQLAIAARYPLVELLTGLVVLTVAVAELFLGGANLPGNSNGGYPGVSWLVSSTRWELVATFGYHAGLLCILLTWAFIRWDGYRLPRRYVLLALIFGVTLPAVASAVQPIPWAAARPDWLDRCVWCHRFDTAIVGGLVGIALGVLQAVVSQFWHRPSDNIKGVGFDLAASQALVGMCLGWQALISAVLLAASIRVVVSTITGGALSRHASAHWTYLTAGVFLQVLAWRALDDLTGWPGSHVTIAAAIAPVCLAMYFSIVASYVECRGADG